MLKSSALGGFRTLEVLQDQVEPGPVEDVAEVLQRELGAPASQLFAEFDPDAKAAASLAQVNTPLSKRCILFS